LASEDLELDIEEELKRGDALQANKQMQDKSATASL